MTVPASPIVSVKPIALDAPGRGTPLEIRVSAPVDGDDLPVVLLSHGYGWHLDGYGPLADFWAAHGFVVIQPTYLDSRRYALPVDDPRTPTIWRRRVADAQLALDRLEHLEAMVPGLAGRVDHGSVAAAGHSFGAQTTGVLLGARVLGPDGTPSEDLSDPRIGAGILLAPAGKGGDDLTPFAAEHFPFMNPHFETLSTRALVVVGDHDDSPLTVRGPDWMTDPYTYSPGAEGLLTLFGAEHSLGGIPGYEAAETTDESPERVALLQRVTLAYLRHALGRESDEWTQVRAELSDSELGKIDLR